MDVSLVDGRIKAQGLQEAPLFHRPRHVYIPCASIVDIRSTHLYGNELEKHIDGQSQTRLPNLLDQD